MKLAFECNGRGRCVTGQSEVAGLRGYGGGCMLSMGLFRGRERPHPQHNQVMRFFRYCCQRRHQQQALQGSLCFRSSRADFSFGLFCTYLTNHAVQQKYAAIQTFINSTFSVSSEQCVTWVTFHMQRYTPGGVDPERYNNDARGETRRLAYRSIVASDQASGC